jgi:hypothetical protein
MARIQTLDLRVARSRLALVWFPLSGAIFLLLVVQTTFANTYAGQDQAVWGWALPNFMPTLALTGSVFAANALEARNREKAVVRMFFFRLAFGLSVFYFVVLFMVLLGPAFAQVVTGDAATVEDRLSVMERSSVFLGPLQSLVVLVIGALFFLKEEKGGGNAG